MLRAQNRYGHIYWKFLEGRHRIVASRLKLAGSQLLLGPLSDRFGRRPVVLAGLALAALASFAAIFAATITGLIVARVVQALGASTGQVVGRAIIRDLYERDRAASMLGIVTSAVVVIPMLSPLIGGILDTAFGWEAIFVLVAAFSFAVLAWAESEVDVLKDLSAAVIAEMWPLTIGWNQPFQGTLNAPTSACGHIERSLYALRCKQCGSDVVFLQ